MKYDREPIALVEGPRSDEYSPCEIPPGNTALVASMLSDMYSDPAFAVVRELVANGVDSHRSAGQDAPVVIEVPTWSSPRLVVRDRGTGMSTEDVERLLFDYTVSTKRDDAEAIGRFGIGHMSPMAVSSQYLVDAAKDGRRTLVSFALVGGADGMPAPSHLVLDTSPTDEPDGVVVTVPIAADAPDADSWHRAARMIASQLDEGLVELVVDGEVEQPPARWDAAAALCPKGQSPHASWLGAERGHEGQRGLAVRMGGIVYDVPRWSDGTLADSSMLLEGLVLHAPLGALTLPPDRESVQRTPANDEALRAMVDAHVKDRWREIVPTVLAATSTKELAAALDGLPEGLARVLGVIAECEAPRLVERGWAPSWGSVPAAAWHPRSTRASNRVAGLMPAEQLLGSGGIKWFAATGANRSKTLLEEGFGIDRYVPGTGPVLRSSAPDAPTERTLLVHAPGVRRSRQTSWNGWDRRSGQLVETLHEHEVLFLDPPARLSSACAAVALERQMPLYLVDDEDLALVATIAPLEEWRVLSGEEVLAEAALLRSSRRQQAAPERAAAVGTLAVVQASGNRPYELRAPIEELRERLADGPAGSAQKGLARKHGPVVVLARVTELAHGTRMPFQDWRKQMLVEEADLVVDPKRRDPERIAADIGVDPASLLRPREAEELLLRRALGRMTVPERRRLVDALAVEDAASMMDQRVAVIGTEALQEALSPEAFSALRGLRDQERVLRSFSDGEWACAQRLGMGRALRRSIAQLSHRSTAWEGLVEPRGLYPRTAELLRFAASSRSAPPMGLLGLALASDVGAGAVLPPVRKTKKKERDRP